jgi:hypothetical protein
MAQERSIPEAKTQPRFADYMIQVQINPGNRGPLYASCLRKRIQDGCQPLLAIFVFDLRHTRL